MMPETSQSRSSSDIVDAALEYADQGFSVIPVRRSDKKPHIKWEEFQKRIATREEIEAWWEKWPEANVAIICGAISGLICVDSDGPKGDRWIFENLPNTGVYSIPSKGVHALYLPPPNMVIRNKVRLAPEVDIRGEGGYFVAPPSIHASGHVYRWEFRMNGWDDLAVYVPPDPHREGGGNLNINLESVKTSPILQPVEEGQRNQTLAQLAGRWFAKGLDIEEVMMLAKAWNENNTPPLGWSELERTVKSIHETHQRNHPELMEQADIKCEIPEPERQETPAAILGPGGLLQDIMDYYKNNSSSSFTLFDLAGAITTVGAVAGQKVMTETGLRTNFYCVSIGGSGSGKNAPIATTANLLAHTSAHAILGPNETTSHSSILSDLKKKPVLLMLFDEIGLLIKALKNPMSPAAQVPRLLNDLFTRTNAPYTKSYASHDEIVIPYHHLSIYGASSPQRFWEALTFNDASDGFIARMLIFQSEHDSEFPKPIVEVDVPEKLVERIESIYSIKTETKGGNLHGEVPVPVIVPKTSEAQKYFMEWAIHYHELGNRHKYDEDGSSSIYRRAAEHASKAALVHKVSQCGGLVVHEQVGMDSVVWATSLIDFLVPNTINQVRANIAANELDQWRIKIIKIVKRMMAQGRKGATKRDVFKFLRGMEDLVFGRAISGMLEAGTLVKTIYKPRTGKECELYCFPENL